MSETVMGFSLLSLTFYISQEEKRGGTSINACISSLFPIAFERV